MAKTKTNKKTRGVVGCILAFIVGIIGSFGGWYLFADANVSHEEAHVFASGTISFHFLELGNRYTGDSVYIKAGENDILIDAGSRANSADTISAYVNKYVTDSKLEYVIATHAHQDHIAGFAGNGTYQSIFEKFECETIIDFSQHNTSSGVYNNYVAKRDAEIASGATHYTALECIEEDKASFDLGDGITMQVLNQAYYSEVSADENNYSVCLLFTQGSKNFLFTGDLEKEGEASLVEKNTLPEVELFKAGHHGSPTSSTDKLLSVIKPKIVCVCACCGAVEYTQTIANTFPSQAFIDRIAPYTADVYVTTLGNVKKEGETYKDVSYESMNGDIVVTSTKDGVTVACSNNNTKLKDTVWFSTYRKRPSAW